MRLGPGYDNCYCKYWASEASKENYQQAYIYI